jgi:bifunctional DNA-binding transcriptional regulator/antitoxin component of YhaV-PrlF toxin-antitoxin module
MEDVELKMDSKGRICLPPDIREEMGDTVIATRTPQGILIKAGRKKEFIEEFNKIIATEPKRTGQPENWPPEKMKDIWVNEGDRRTRH